MKILILSVKTGSSPASWQKKYIKLQFENILVYFHLEKNPQNITLMLLDQIISAWSSLSNSSDAGMDNGVADV